MKCKVELIATGDPNKGQDPTRSVGKAWAIMKHVNSIEEAQKAVRDYIEKHDLGEGNWSGGKVWTEKNEYLGHITFDGCFHEDDSIRAF